MGKFYVIFKICKNLNDIFFLNFNKNLFDIKL